MINKELKKHLEVNVIPLYDKLDLAHQRSHVYEVIDNSFNIANSFDVNLDMIYTIAVYHDVGLIKERKTHHLIGGQMLLDDETLKLYFNDEQMIIMQQAVEDHRASLPYPQEVYMGR